MRWILIILFIGLWVHASAQQPVVFWKNSTVKTGQKAILTIVVPTKNCKHSEWSGEIECGIKRNNQSLFQEKSMVEVISYHDTIVKGKWKATYEFMAWDSAQFQFPKAQFTINDSVVYATIPFLNVLFKKQQVNADIDQITVPKPEPEATFLEKYWWAIALLILVLILAIVLNIRKRSKPKSIESLREQTLTKITQLEEQQLWRKGKLEQHYVRYSHILREFLTHKYQVRFTEKTSKETGMLLKQLNLSDGIQQQIINCLSESDFIKFGQADASEAFIQQRLLALKELVVTLSPIELPE